MRQYFVVMAAAATVSLSVLFAPSANAVTLGTGNASGIQQGAATIGGVEKVVRVCRHRFMNSSRYCYVDRSRPPTVCHHLRNSSARDCY